MEPLMHFLHVFYSQRWEKKIFLFCFFSVDMFVQCKPYIFIVAPCCEESNTSQERSQGSPTCPMAASIIAPLSLIYRV